MIFILIILKIIIFSGVIGSYQCQPALVAVAVAECWDSFDRKEASFSAKTELIDAIFTLKLIEAIAAEFELKTELMEDNLSV